MLITIILQSSYHLNLCNKSTYKQAGRWLSLNSVLGYLGYFPKIFAPKMRTSIKRTRKIKNNILAIEAAPAAMPVKPKIAAIIAIMKNIAAHLSISQSLKGEQLFITYLKFHATPFTFFRYYVNFKVMRALDAVKPRVSKEVLNIMKEKRGMG